MVFHLLQRPQETTHTPQGDGNCFRVMLISMVLETTHTPQGDGNLHLPLLPNPLSPRNNPHPARGRKPDASSTPSRGLRNNPHPARGRKPAGHRAPRHPLPETTHTPQGDGNCHVVHILTSFQETTHTPQGDGNPGQSELALSQKKRPTPRKGTETRLLVGMSLGVLETTHTPQGDGNFCIFVIGIADSRNNPHPARGRKPDSRGLCS